MGEEPSLWAKFRLWHYHVPNSPFREEYEPELHEVLTLRRFQALEFLHIASSKERLSISIDLLEYVLIQCPVLRKLKLEFGAWEECLKFEEIDQVALILVKFEELDLSEDEDIAFTHVGLAPAVMRALLKALPEEGSKLKVLTIFGLEMFMELGPYFDEAVDKLRQAGVKVDVILSGHWCDTDFDESDE